MELSRITADSEAIAAQASEDYRYLHRIAEVGECLPRTAEYVKDRLRPLGYSPTDVGGGIVATVGKGERCILLRADMDALPIREETGLEFASVSSSMHACGHDMHTAMLLGAAKLLKAREGELSATVKLCFQPGEETLSGAKRMIDGGLLRDPVPDAAVMLHVLTGVSHKTGTLIIPPSGVGASGADFFRITVRGEGCHGATPHLGRDPIPALSNIITVLSSLTARELPAESAEVLTVGRITAGDSANAIPDSAVALGTLRSYDDENREYLKKRLFEVCKGVSEAFRCNGCVEITSSAPSFVNSEKLRHALCGIFRTAVPCPFIVPNGTRGGGSEDFAYVSREVPSIMLCLAAGGESDGYAHPLHSPKAMFDERALPFGIAVYTAAAIELPKLVL